MADGETQDVGGISLPLSLETSGWSAGIEKAKSELAGLQEAAAGVAVPAGRRSRTSGGAGLAVEARPRVTPAFSVTSHAVRDLRSDINATMRTHAMQGQAVGIPIKLGRVPWAALRREIATEIGTVPIKVSIGQVVPQSRNILQAMMSVSSGQSMGKAQQQIESAAASRGIPRRAAGGTVTRGSPVIVGDAGRPEVFVPESHGRIIPRIVKPSSPRSIQRRWQVSRETNNWRDRMEEDLLSEREDPNWDYASNDWASSLPHRQRGTPRRASSLPQSRPWRPRRQPTPRRSREPRWRLGGAAYDSHMWAGMEALDYQEHGPKLFEPEWHAGAPDWQALEPQYGSPKPRDVWRRFPMARGGRMRRGLRRLQDEAGLRLDMLIDRYDQMAPRRLHRMAGGITRSDPYSHLWDVPERPGEGGAPPREGLRIYGGRGGWYTVRHLGDSSHERMRPKRLHDLLRLYDVTEDELLEVGLKKRAKGTPRNMTPEQMDYVGNLREVAKNIRPEHLKFGKAWYSDAQEYAHRKAVEYGVSPKVAIGVLAALSAGTAWDANKKKFERVMQTRGLGMWGSSTDEGFPYNMNLDAHRKARAILSGADPWEVLGHTPKVGQFYRNLSGDLDAVTLDRWAYRSATRGALSQYGKGPVRDDIDAAFRQVAKEMGLHPVEFQAAAWLYERETNPKAKRGKPQSLGQLEGIFSPMHHRRRGGPIHAWRGARAEAYRQTLENEGGTFGPEGAATRGYVVGLEREGSAVIPAEDRLGFIRAYRHLERSGVPNVGTWSPAEESPRQIYLDPAVHLRRKREAERLTLKEGQRAYFDLQKMDEVYPRWRRGYPAPGQMSMHLYDPRVRRRAGGTPYLPAGYSILKNLYPNVSDVSKAMLMGEIRGARAENAEDLLTRMEELGLDFPETADAIRGIYPMTGIDIGLAMANPSRARMGRILGITGAPRRRDAWSSAFGPPSHIPLQSREFTDSASVIGLRKALFRIDARSLLTQREEAGALAIGRQGLGDVFAHEFGHALDATVNMRLSKRPGFRGTMPISAYGERGGPAENFAEWFSFMTSKHPDVQMLQDIYAEAGGLPGQIRKWQQERSRSQGGVAKRGGLPRGYKVEFLGPEDDYGRIGWTASGSLPSVPTKKLKKPVRIDQMGAEVTQNDIFGTGATAHIGDVFAHVTYHGKTVGTFPFTYDPVQDAMHPELSYMELGHRRKGIASSVYSRLERFTGVPVEPSEDQLIHGRALWSDPERAFGRRFGARPLSSDDAYKIAHENQREREWAEQVAEDAQRRERMRAAINPQGPLGSRITKSRQGPTRIWTVGEPRPAEREGWGPLGDLIAALRIGAKETKKKEYRAHGTPKGDWGLTPAGYMGPMSDFGLGGFYIGGRYTGRGSMLQRLNRDLVGHPMSETALNPLFLHAMTRGVGDPELERVWGALMRPGGSLLSPFRGRRPKLMAHGGDAGGQPYIVGEIGRELFVPDRKRHLIPADVFSQLPKRAAGGRADKPLGGGLVELGAGEHLWTPKEDGWVIPNRLMNKVPRRADGTPTLEPPGSRRRRTIYVEPASGELRYERGYRVGGRFATYEQFQRAQQARVAAMRQPGGTRPGIENVQPQYATLAAADYETRRPTTASLETRKSSLRAETDYQASIRGLTGRAAAGGIAQFIFGGKRDRLELQNELRAINDEIKVWSKGLEPGQTALEHWRWENEKANSVVEVGERHTAGLRKELERTDLSTTKRRKLNKELAEAEDQHTIALEHQTRVAKDFEHVSGLYRRADQVQKDMSVGLGEVAQNFAATTVAGVAFNVGMQAASAALGLASKASAPLVDQLTGFGSTSTRVTAELAKTAQQTGNVGAALAQAAGQGGLGAAGMALVGQNLTTSVTAKAAGAASTQGMDLRRAAYGAANAPTGLFGGYGGFLGTPFLASELFGGGKGFTENIAGEAAGYANLLAQPIVQPKPGVRMPEPRMLPTSEAGQKWLREHPENIGGAGTLTPEQEKANAKIFDALKTEASDYNEAVVRGSRYLGQNTSALQLMTKEQLKATGMTDEAVAKLATDFEITGGAAGDQANAQTMATAGLILFDKATGQAVSSAKEYQDYFKQAAQGTLLPTMEEYAKQQALAIQGQRAATAEQARYQQQIEIPGALGQQLAANPFAPAVTGTAFAPGVGPVTGPYSGGGAARAQLGMAQRLQDQLMQQATAGIAAQQQAIAQNVGAPEAAQFGTLMGNPIQSMNQSFGSLMSTIQSGTGSVSDYGAAISKLNANIANRQATLGVAQYNEQMRIMNRNLAYAKGLAGQGGGAVGGQPNLGALERQQFMIGRASESLSMALSQRQINFQQAVAGFQAPGITGQERAARIEEAKIAAQYAQQQLDYQRQQFSIAGTVFQVNAQNQLTDLGKQRDIAAQSFAVEQAILADQKIIAGLTIGQAQLQAKAQSLTNQASSNFNTTLSAAAGYVSQFGDSITAATDVIRAATGQTPIDRGSGNKRVLQSGWVGNVSRPASLTIGEAGNEMAAILRHPRTMPLTGGIGGGGGPMQMNITVNVTGNSISSQMDLHEIGRKIAEEVEVSLGNKAQLLRVQGLFG